jgi:hypothetical protein
MGFGDGLSLGVSHGFCLPRWASTRHLGGLRSVHPRVMCAAGALRRVRVADRPM